MAENYIDKKELGARLRRIRKSRNMTMLEVAESVGVSESLVSRWERGNIDLRRTKIQVVSRLCSVYGLQVNNPRLKSRACVARRKP